MKGKGLSREFLEESFEYLRSDEAKEISKTNTLNQITEYLNNKFDSVEVSYTIEGDEGTFKIEGGSPEERLEILNCFKDIGII